MAFRCFKRIVIAFTPLIFIQKLTMTLQLKKGDLKFETFLQEANRFRGRCCFATLVLPPALGAAPSLGASQSASYLDIPWYHYGSVTITAGSWRGLAS